MYRDIVQASPDGIWLVELSGRTIYANPAMTAMLGCTQEGMAALPIQGALDEQGALDWAAHVASLEAGRPDPGDVEVLLHRADGSAFWALANQTLLEADAELGLPRRLLVCFADWDERRGVMQHEARSRQTLDEAERIARLGSWVSDAATGELEPSEGLSQLLDLPEGPLRTEHLVALLPDDDPGFRESYAAADLAVRPFSTEARLRTPTGYRWFAVRVARGVGPEGREVRHGTVVDIHEHRLVESALEDAVLQNVLLQTAATAANEAPSFEEALRRSLQLILGTGEWERARAFRPAADDALPVPFYVNHVDCLADEEDPTTVPIEREIAARVIAERRFIWSDAGGRGGPMVAFPIGVPDEVIAVGVISSTTPVEHPDMVRAVLAQAGSQLARIAERDRVAEALEEARDAAMEASRQKSDFLATMSHEIRTPLNGVIGLNDLLLRGHLEADQQRLATGIQVSSRVLLGIINDILDFSKIEAGHLALEEMDFDVRAVLDQVASVLGESARTRGLELLVGCDPDVPAVLCGDPTRLAQVLNNLGSNAVKFTESGSVTIRVSLAADDRSEPAPDASARAEVDGEDAAGPGAIELRVEVTDTGAGIPEDQRAAIFDPFEQGDASTTRKHGGTGLGLAICRDIVAALGGRIAVESVLGRGSVFWFSAVFRPAIGDEPSAEDRAAREALTGRHVLVVDDHELNRLILAEHVGWWGVRCTTVTSVSEGMDALRAAAPGGYDLVLLDLAMPERDGFELAAEVQASPELGDVALVMLGSMLPPDPARLREAGIAGSLTKPVLASTLRALLLRYLAPEAFPATAAASLPKTAILSAKPGFERRRVLVVEDNPINQMVAIGMLDAVGYAADVADDGDKALEAISRGSSDRYGAVLMDLEMPRMDGVAATRALRKLEAEWGHDAMRLPVIAMTASVVRGERERCLAAGMDDFLSKPVDPNALAAAMDRWTLAPEAAGGDLTPPTPGEADGAEPVGESEPGQATWRPDPGPAAVRDPNEVPELVPRTPWLSGPLDRDRVDLLWELDGQGGYLTRVVGRFSVDRERLVGPVAEAADAGSPEALRSAAHSLKGTLNNLGLVHAGKLALELEELATDGVVVGAPAHIPALRAAVEEGLGLLLEYCAAHGRGVPGHG